MATAVRMCLVELTTKLKLYCEVVLSSIPLGPLIQVSRVCFDTFLT